MTDAGTEMESGIDAGTNLEPIETAETGTETDEWKAALTLGPIRNQSKQRHRKPKLAQPLSGLSRPW